MLSEEISKVVREAGGRKEKEPHKRREGHSVMHSQKQHRTWG